MILGILGVALALVLPRPAAAQVSTAPPPETEQFARLAGDWAVSIWGRDSVGSWPTTPDQALWSWRVILGGHAVQDFWTREGPDGPSFGTNVRIYDPETRSWAVRWTASDDRSFMELTGRQEGDSLRLYTTHVSGRPLRITFHDIRDDRFLWRLDVGGEDTGSWSPMSRMEARRIPTGEEAPSPAAAAANRTRAFDLRVVVDRSPAEVIRDWTTESTLDRFMGVSSNVQARVNGAYEIRFRPGDDTESRANATIGARILELEEGRHLAFEWRVPPWTGEPARSAPPTRVDVWVTPGDAHPAAGGTIIHLRHSGFGHGASWDPVHDFFQWSWFEILARYRDLTSVGGR